MMKFYIVDVFAQQRYQGNQLAVFMPDGDVPDAEMLQIAREINFSESSFIRPGKRENGGYDVRIFTPDVEVPFAGHPTLGTAYIIHRVLEHGQTDRVVLNLKAGAIPVSVSADGLVMQQNQPSFDLILTDRQAVAELLNIGADDILEAYPMQVVSTGLPCLIIPLASLDALRRCAVNHAAFQRFLDNTCRCNLLVFVPDGEDHLRVRVFMDDTGFLEDAATGSANGNLAGYVLQYNVFGKQSVQYSVGQGHEMNRPSLLRVGADMAGEAFRIQVGGDVHLIAEGNWL